MRGPPKAEAADVLGGCYGIQDLRRPLASKCGMAQILNPIAAAEDVGGLGPRQPQPEAAEARSSRGGAVVQMRAAQNHNPIAVKIELILLMSSGMGNFHDYFHSALLVFIMF